jgi:hypothetical protein
MIASRRQQPKRASRKCIFCGEGGTPGNPMTEEHLWPEWMHPYLPQLPGIKTRAGRHRIRVGEILVERKLREGHVFTKRYKLVCKRCNTVWMSKIESDAKPLLIPLLRGVPITLLRNHRITISRWIALKVMVTECIDALDAVVTESERENFMLTRHVPHSMRIWIGTHNSQDWYTAYWHQTLLAHFGNAPPETPPLASFKNIQTTTIGVGHIFFLSFVTTIDDLKFNPNVGALRFIRRLWPMRDRPIVWPLPALSGDQADRLANCLRELARSPIVQWMPFR